MKASACIKTCCLSSLLILLAVISYGQKRDTIELKNGNIITGEIKRLELGMLSYSTDAMSMVEVKWEEVTRIKSPRFLEIWDNEGYRYFGSLGFADERGKATLILTNAAMPVELSRITNIYPIRKKFINRLEGSADVGFSYTKATRNTQFNLSGHLFYKAALRSLDFRVNSILTRSSDSISSKKQDAKLLFRRVIKGPWFANVLTAAEQNTELGIHLRTSLSAGISRDLLRDVHNLLDATVGVSINREWTTSADTAMNNAEGLITIRYKRFKHTSPKMDITASGSLFPSISAPGRVRTDSDIKARVEVISSLYVGLSFYFSFDNEPLTSGAARDDWGTVMSVGYSFP